MKVVEISNIDRWRTELLALDTPGPLPTGVVLVPSEAHAHALRVALVAHATHGLAGTRFLTAAAAARAVLEHAGIDYRPGEEARRPLRIRKLLRAEPPFAAWSAARLCTSGWEAAFAATLEQLELAALSPDDVARLADPRAADLALLWRLLDDDAGTSWTIPRIFTEASRVLREVPGAWPFPGPVLAAASLTSEAAHARFLRAIPDLVLGIAPSRPTPPEVIDRVRLHFGEAAARIAVRGPEVDRVRPSELGILGEGLFAPPDALADASRRRSTGPDGTVSLELHASMDEELDAAVRWVAEEVFAHHTALRELAILTPTVEPWASLLADRLAALPWPADARPIYLAAGCAATATIAGERLLAVIRALEAYLPREEVTALLPRLRLTDREGHLSPAQARKLVDALGAAGGSPARPHEVVHWRSRWDVLATEDPGRAVAGALDALTAIAGAMVQGASLLSLWHDLRAFATTHLLASRQLPALLDQLEGELRALAEDELTAPIVGHDAIGVICSTLTAMRLLAAPTGAADRHGTPAVYIGSLAGAAGLPFAAVRVVGLAESVFPGTLRTDPVLPPALRARLPRHTIIDERTFALIGLHALDRVIRDTRERICLSASRTGPGGREYEPAGIFLDVAAALARAGVNTHARRPAPPPFAFDWLAQVARDPSELPSHWQHAPITTPSEVHARAATLELALPTVRLPGVDASDPISVSAVARLLTCPRRFLFEHVLALWPRSVAPETHRISPLAYGELFHATAETFACTHGEAFGNRTHDLAHWLACGDAISDRQFTAFVQRYPLIGCLAHDREHRRLRRDLRTFLEDDWAAAPRAGSSPRSVASAPTARSRSPRSTDRCSCTAASIASMSKPASRWCATSRPAGASHASATSRIRIRRPISSSRCTWP